MAVDDCKRSLDHVLTVLKSNGVRFEDKRAENKITLYSGLIVPHDLKVEDPMKTL